MGGSDANGVSRMKITFWNWFLHFRLFVFIYLTYSLLLLILHLVRGDRLCAGSDENGREEQPRMRRCVAPKPEVCKMHPILISISYCCTVFLTTFIIPPDFCVQGGSLHLWLSLLVLIAGCICAEVGCWN